MDAVFFAFGYVPGKRKVFGGHIAEKSMGRADCSLRE